MWAARRVIGTPALRRSLCDATSPAQAMAAKLQNELGAGTEVKVNDVSGGCGSAYDVEVSSPAFEGKSKVMQARSVYKILASEIAEMHSINVKTSKPAS